MLLDVRTLNYQKTFVEPILFHTLPLTYAATEGFPTILLR